MIANKSGDRYARSLGKHKASTRETATATRPTNSEDPSNVHIIHGCCPDLEFLLDPERE